MKILVTGGAGFIGSHITEALCDHDYEVVVVDDLSFGHSALLDKRVEFIKGDYGNEKVLTKALEGVDLVIHLAGSSIIKFAYDNPVTYFENNLTKGIYLLESMKKMGVNKIIYSSTAAVYGNPQKVPIKEGYATSPVNAYGASKYAFEVALKAYYHSYNIQSVSFRFFNAYGPRDEQDPATRAVPMWINALLRNKPVEVYWGAKQVRDYVYVKDLAEAYLKVLNLQGCHVFNLGSGKGIIMEDIIKNLEHISGHKLKRINKKGRIGDPPKLIANIAKVYLEIGWRPQTSLYEGLQNTYEYYKNKALEKHTL